jgi:hypothetical protein
MDRPPPFDPDDYDLPKDPYETCETDDESIMELVRKRASTLGGRMIPGRHKDRFTIFKISQSGTTTKKEVALANCGHEAQFAIPPERGGRMVTACAVCDCGDRWPRLSEDV